MKEEEMGLECGTYGRRNMCSVVWLGKLKERTTLKTRCDGRIICKMGTKEKHGGGHQFN